MSCDTVPSKFAWANRLGDPQTRLLSDFWPHGRMSRLYGLFREKDGFSQRANVLVDEDRRISYVKVYESGEMPVMQDVLRFIRERV